jgi:RND family efflux transporter MFP subunit
MLVEVENVQSEQISEQIWVSGTVVSRTDSNIASEVAGRVTWMADVGDLVEAGEVLAKLDDHRFLLESEQNLANIARWQSTVKLLSRKQERFSQMAKSNAASRDELDQVLSDLEVAKQELAQAEINKKLTDHQLSQTQVRAPFKALVVERIQSPGEYTAVGADMLRIVDTSNVEASIRAPLSAVPFIANGMRINVKRGSLEKEQSIRTIVPVGNALSRMMEVRVSLEAGDFAIGSAVRVALPHSEYYQAMTVPRDALVLRQAGTFIYLVDQANIAHQIPVTTGIGVGPRIEVKGELDDDMPVVIRGAERLKAGQKVRYKSDSEIAKRV